MAGVVAMTLHKVTTCVIFLMLCVQSVFKFYMSAIQQYKNAPGKKQAEKIRLKQETSKFQY